MENKPVALVDMDGTLCDFKGALERNLSEFMVASGMERSTLRPVAIQNLEYLIRGQPGWYRKLKPLPLGFSIVALLRDIGFRIMITTKASTYSKNAWTEKVEWISEHLPDVDMTITMDKGLVYGRVLVDDNPDHFEPWMKWRPRGIVLMPVQPWNEETLARPNLYAIEGEEDLKFVRPVLENAFYRKTEPD